MIYIYGNSLLCDNKLYNGNLNKSCNITNDPVCIAYLDATYDSCYIYVDDPDVKTITINGVEINLPESVRSVTTNQCEYSKFLTPTTIINHESESIIFTGDENYQESNFRNDSNHEITIKVNGTEYTGKYGGFFNRGTSASTRGASVYFGNAGLCNEEALIDLKMGIGSDFDWSIPEAPFLLNFNTLNIDNPQNGGDFKVWTNYDGPIIIEDWNGNSVTLNMIGYKEREGKKFQTELTDVDNDSFYRYNNIVNGIKVYDTCTSLPSIIEDGKECIVRIDGENHSCKINYEELEFNDNGLDIYLCYPTRGVAGIFDTLKHQNYISVIFDGKVYDNLDVYMLDTKTYSSIQNGYRNDYHNSINNTSDYYMHFVFGNTKLLSVLNLVPKREYLPEVNTELPFAFFIDGRSPTGYLIYKGYKENLDFSIDGLLDRFIENTRNLIFYYDEETDSFYSAYELITHKHNEYNLKPENKYINKISWEFKGQPFTPSCIFNRISVWYNKPEDKQPHKFEVFVKE